MQIILLRDHSICLSLKVRLELQVSAHDNDIDFSPFSVKEIDRVQERVYKITALDFHCGLLLMDFKCCLGF